MISKAAAIWQIVAAIPAGKVATYGQIARLAGYPNQARAVGRVLKNLPADTLLPWHRVVNSRGKLSFAVGSKAYCRQRSRLESEGVVFDRQRLSLQLYRWQA